MASRYGRLVSHQRVADAAVVGFAGQRVRPPARRLAVGRRGFPPVPPPLPRAFPCRENARRGRPADPVHPDATTCSSRISNFRCRNRLKASKVSSVSSQKSDSTTSRPRFLNSALHSVSARPMPVVEAGWTASSSVDQVVQMPARAARRQKLFQCFREQNQRRLVALVNHQVGQRRGDLGGQQHIWIRGPSPA